MYALLVRPTSSNQYLGIYVLLTSLAVTLIVTPFNSLDPVNLPKLGLLIVFSFSAAGLIFSNVQFLTAKEYRVTIVSASFFLAQLVLALIFDSRDFSSKFYGIFGRNTGFVAYLSLTLLLLASVASASRIQLQRYIIAIVATGGLLATYGFIQSKGKDFYQFDGLDANNTFGTFGNPNFQSAFMGVASATALTLVFYSRAKKSYKIGSFILTLLYLYNISVSSQQGYFNFTAGIAAATAIFLFKSQKLILAWTTLAISTVGGFLILLGLFNSGPLAQFIYKGSLQARGFYWQAATTMILEQPFFGVGMDGFGDAYLRARTSEIASINFGISSDTAHSIPLDIGSNGGFLLLISYLAIIVLVLVSIFRTLKRTSDFDVVFTAIIAAWVAYQAQSLISINQLGLGVWGWSLSGLIIGYEITSRRENPVLTHKAIPAVKVTKEKISSIAIASMFLTTNIGIGIALPPVIAANKFYKALQTGDPRIIQDSAYLRPNERMRYLYVARALQENKYEPEAIRVLRDAAKIYPDSIDLWRIWASIPSANPADVARAKAEMKRLDPFNPNP